MFMAKCPILRSRRSREETYRATSAISLREFPPKEVIATTGAGDSRAPRHAQQALALPRVRQEHEADVARASMGRPKERRAHTWFDGDDAPDLEHLVLEPLGELELHARGAHQDLGRVAEDAHGAIYGVVVDEAQGVIDDLAVEGTDLRGDHEPLVAEIKGVVGVDLVEMGDEVGEFRLYGRPKRGVTVETPRRWQNLTTVEGATWTSAAIPRAFSTPSWDRWAIR